jgi:hypothetical protein
MLTKVNPAIPHATPDAGGSPDSGRVILEALVGLSLVALAVVGWGRASITATRTEVAAANREVALELASNNLEELSVREWPVAAVASSPDEASRFEGRAIIRSRNGVPAMTVVERNGRTFEIRRYVTESGNPAWRHTAVLVGWREGERDAEVRLDGAIRRPDPPPEP